MGSGARIGILGTGFIAGRIAAIAPRCQSARITAVASRDRRRARAFAGQHNILRGFGCYEEMISSPDIDAVYITAPTALREELCLAAVGEGKHILVEKPFPSAESLDSVLGAAARAGVAFMDATHMSHHPRTARIKQAIAADLGETRALRAAFFGPLADRGNIRYDRSLEPLGAAGDLAWYCLRAAVEFLGSNEQVAEASGFLVHDSGTGAVVRCAGVLGFSDGRSLSMDAGFDTGAMRMDLDIIGAQALYRLDDFVLDWQADIGLAPSSRPSGYTRCAGVEGPDADERIPCAADRPAAAHMLDSFAAVCASPQGPEAAHSADLSRRTQRLLDIYWRSAGGPEGASAPRRMAQAG